MAWACIALPFSHVEPPRHLARAKSRVDVVHSNAIFCVGLCKRLGESHKGMLGGCISSAVRTSRLRVDTPAIYNGARVLVVGFPRTY